jgi:hypothetical protein
MPSTVKSKKHLPFEFVLDYLYPKEPTIKPMFGCFAIYIDRKIVLVLRDRKEHPADNGVWIATTKEHHASLKKEFPSMRSIKLLGKGVTGWQVLPASANDFESSVIRACECVLKGDPRIGKLPKRTSGKKRTTVTRGQKNALSSSR